MMECDGNGNEKGAKVGAKATNQQRHLPTVMWNSTREDDGRDTRGGGKGPKQPSGCGPETPDCDNNCVPWNTKE